MRKDVLPDSSLKMATMQEVKYRGCVPLLDWRATHAQPRPGLIEVCMKAARYADAKANIALKVLLNQPKLSVPAVLAMSETGIKCTDTSTNPPKV